MFRSHVLVAQPVRFFRGKLQDTVALLAQRHVHGSGDALANGDALLDFLADGFDGAVGAQNAIGHGLVFAQKAEEKVFRLDVRAAVLGGLVPRKKDHPSRLLRIAFKHGSPGLSPRAARGSRRRLFLESGRARVEEPDHNARPIPDYEWLTPRSAAA